MKAPNFDRVARSYRYLEYLTLGLTLQRCRTHFLPHLLDCKRALILGDGDGRFLAQLLAQNPRLRADAVDISASMLKLLRRHCEAASPDTALRLRTHHTSALKFIPTKRYDLVVTHFFLDCLTQQELALLISRLTPALTSNAIWLISDFRIPIGPMRLPARVIICALYFAFRILTGLRTNHLPDYALALSQGGFTRISHHHSLAGMLATELWRASTAK